MPRSIPAESMIDLKLLEKHIRLTIEARETLMYHRFDPHLHQPIFAEVVLPKFSSRAQGCHIWDILGNSFIDWTGGVESSLFGHRHPVIVEAIRTWATDEQTHQLDIPARCDGPLTDPRELSIAKRLTKIFGDDLLVGFSRGRSEALYSATEMARTLSGRPMLAVHEVHSTRTLFSEDQRFRYTRSHFEENNVKTIPFNDLRALSWLLKSNAEQFAAVVINPFAFKYPDVGYFRDMKQMLDEHGTLLVLDESETAFRMELGGAQQHLSLQPDITIVGEKLGGPFAFSAVLGKRELLSRAWRSTMKTNDRPGGLTLDVVESALATVVEQNVPSALRHAGQQLQDEFNQTAELAGMSCRLVGHPTRMAIQFQEHDFLTIEQQRAAFCIAALEQGIITHGEFSPNIAHDDQIIHTTLTSLEKVLESLANWMSGLSRPEEAIGEPHAKYDIRGRIDSLNMIRKTMVLSGWILIDGQPVDLSAVTEEGQRIEAEKIHRGDLELGMPQYPAAPDAGFKLSVPLESIKKPSRFLIDAHRNDQLLYRMILMHDPAENTSGPYPFTDGYIQT